MAVVTGQLLGLEGCDQKHSGNITFCIQIYVATDGRVHTQFYYLFTSFIRKLLFICPNLEGARPLSHSPKWTGRKPTGCAVCSPLLCPLILLYQEAISAVLKHGCRERCPPLPRFRPFDCNFIKSPFNGIILYRMKHLSFALALTQVTYIKIYSKLSQ